MFDEFQALYAIRTSGGVGRAAVQLGITQPALTKRIRRFETQLNRQLIERVGRGVMLTSYALHLCDSAGPLLAELKEVLASTIIEKRAPITMAMTDSSLVSWGADFLGWLLKSKYQIEIQPMEVPSATVVTQQVLGGEAMIGVIRGRGDQTYGLEVRLLTEEAMCLVPANLKPLDLRRGMTLDILSVEAKAESHQIALRKLKRLMPKCGIAFSVSDNYRSGPAVVAAAKAGLGHGLVTVKLAQVMGIPEKILCPLPAPGVSVPTSLLARKRVLALNHIQPLLKALKRYFED
jgi:DNA-binding transcriptional LysR family regulator